MYNYGDEPDMTVYAKELKKNGYNDNVIVRALMSIYNISMAEAESIVEEPYIKITLTGKLSGETDENK